MKSNFQAALVEILRHEGGYVDHPRDPGGATNKGITRETLAAWRKVRPYYNLPKSEVKNISDAEVAAIYKARFWDTVAGDLLPAGLDLTVFDYSVHSGPSRSAKQLQRLLGVKQDGKIGPATLRSLAREDVPQLIRDFHDARMVFLRNLSIFKTFGRGWTSRVDNVQKVSLLWVSRKPVATPKAPTPSITPKTTAAPLAGRLSALFLSLVKAFFP